jgi:phosphoadenosine phosphosulfate reductase
MRCGHRPGQVALVSSFGAESVVLLHLVSVIAPETPVLFIDTRMLFPETLAYQRDLAERLNLCDLRTIRAHPLRVAASDPEGCCTSSTPMPAATCARWCRWSARCGLRRLDHRAQAVPERRPRHARLLRGRGRFPDQGQPAGALGPRGPRGLHGEQPPAPASAGGRGYPSIGCAPCTSPVAAGEDPRAGRWRGQSKTECGIHFINGRIVRPGQENAA